MTDNVVFQLWEVAEILGMSRSTVKNWTIGRPLAIKPSLRVARGTGSSNLYARGDLLLFALAVQMTRDGFAMETVKRVVNLQNIEREPVRIGSYFSFLLISSIPKTGLEIKLLTDRFRKDVQVKILVAKHGALAYYLLDLKALAESVEQCIEKFNAVRGAAKQDH